MNNEEAKKTETKEPEADKGRDEREALITRLVAAADKHARKRQVKFTKEITSLVAVLGKHQTAHLAVITQNQQNETTSLKKDYEKAMRALSEKYQRDTERLKAKYEDRKSEINAKFKGQYTDHENQLKSHQTTLSDDVAGFQEQIKELNVEQLTKLLAEGQVLVTDDPAHHQLIRTPEKLQEVREADAKRETENTGTSETTEAAQPESAGEPGEVEGGVPAQE